MSNDTPSIDDNRRPGTPLFSEVLENRQRRQFLKSGAGLLSMTALAPYSTAIAASAGRALASLPGFTGVPISTQDVVTVPPEFLVELLYAWGDPISDGPFALADASDSATAQALQAGMHHDGMHFFPFIEGGKPSSTHGLMCINHEYTDDGLLHLQGMSQWSADKVAKSQAAHGVSVIEIRRWKEGWEVVRPSRWARRITANTPCVIAGPAAGTEWMQTRANPSGRLVLGTFSNCAMGVTPWGSYLSCEENFNGYFRTTHPTRQQKRYGLHQGSGFRWHEFDPRFDLDQHPNEANRFGWVVEIDPRRPQSPPIKRTALGRFKHEGATVTQAKDGRVVVYMGDDEKFEYLYKYVSHQSFNPSQGGDNSHLLDEGTLHVARFNEDGSGEWLPLVFGHPGLNPEAGFKDQADILVHCRQAADALKATAMDRPEWIAVHPKTGEVYVSLTNNTSRGAPDQPGPDAANPRSRNIFGHIIRWREKNGNASALRFEWDIFVAAGDPGHPDPKQRGTIQGDAFGSPDGLWFDPAGHLWIQTDVSTSVMGKGDYANLGNNQMLVADPASGEIRRFLTGPLGCEITGITATPDGKTLFVNIQHPGETPSERSDPARPMAISAWPSNQFPHSTGGRPRSATVCIRRKDGGKVY